MERRLTSNAVDARREGVAGTSFPQCRLHGLYLFRACLALCRFLLLSIGPCVRRQATVVGRLSFGSPKRSSLGSNQLQVCCRQLQGRARSCWHSSQADVMTRTPGTLACVLGLLYGSGSHPHLRKQGHLDPMNSASKTTYVAPSTSQCWPGLEVHIWHLRSGCYATAVYCWPLGNERNASQSILDTLAGLLPG